MIQQITNKLNNAAYRYGFQKCLLLSLLVESMGAEQEAESSSACLEAKQFIFSWIMDSITVDQQIKMQVSTHVVFQFEITLT